MAKLASEFEIDTVARSFIYLTFQRGCIDPSMLSFSLSLSGHSERLERGAFV
jgi:hypothetical protein